MNLTTGLLVCLGCVISLFCLTGQVSVMPLTATLKFTTLVGDENCGPCVLNGCFGTLEENWFGLLSKGWSKYAIVG